MCINLIVRLAYVGEFNRTTRICTLIGSYDKDMRINLVVQRGNIYLI